MGYMIFPLHSSLPVLVSSNLCNIFMNTSILAENKDSLLFNSKRISPEVSYLEYFLACNIWQQKNSNYESYSGECEYLVLIFSI